MTVRAEDELLTERLVLRRLSTTDVRAFLAIADDFEVARMTSDIPHPLNRAKAQAWLAPSSGEARFAIVCAGRMIGSAGYFRRSSESAELGFWLGRTWWGRGYTTEAARALVRHGFEVGKLAVFTSSHFVDNPASARVLEKLGFRPTGSGRIWSAARGHDVAAELLELTREHAETVMDLAPVRLHRQSRWSALIERVRGA